MPRGGHNRKPAKLKVVAGTNRKHRSVENEPVIKGDVDITPPSDLDELETSIWNKTASVLKDAKILTRADLLQLKSYCIQAGIMDKAAQELRSYGIVIDHGGRRVRNPASAILKEASMEMRALSVSLGLDPAARSKIDTGEKSGKKSGFADL